MTIKVKGIMNLMTFVLGVIFNKRGRRKRTDTIPERVKAEAIHSSITSKTLIQLMSDAASVKVVMSTKKRFHSRGQIFPGRRLHIRVMIHAREDEINENNTTVVLAITIRSLSFVSIKIIIANRKANTDNEERMIEGKAKFKRLMFFVFFFRSGNFFKIISRLEKLNYNQ